MKKNEIIEIEGIEFEYREGLKDKHIRYWDLNECYRNPSWEKQCAFNAWRKWYEKLAGNHMCGMFGIHNYSCQHFRLVMQFPYHNKIYRAYVTGMHNYIEEICAL